MRNRVGTTSSNQTTPTAAPAVTSSIPGGAPGVPTDDAGMRLPALVPEAPVVADAMDGDVADTVAVERYRVTNGGHVMVNGYRTVMRVGKLVDERTYDLASLRQQGIKLEAE